MTDDQGNYYQQFGNPGNQYNNYQPQYPQQMANLLIRTINNNLSLITKTINRLKFIKMVPRVNTTIPIKTQLDIRNIGASPPTSNRTIGEKDQRAFTMFLWGTMIWEGITFGINFSMLLVYLTKSSLDSPITMWIIQIVASAGKYLLL
mgnify:CR=1 FL=1